MEIQFIGFSANLLAITGAVYLIVMAAVMVVATIVFAGTLICMMFDEKFLEDCGVHAPTWRSEQKVELAGFEEFCEKTIDIYDKILTPLYQEDE